MRHSRFADARNRFGLDGTSDDLQETLDHCDLSEFWQIERSIN